MENINPEAQQILTNPAHAKGTEENPISQGCGWRLSGGYHVKGAESKRHKSLAGKSVMSLGFAPGLTIFSPARC